LLSSTLQVGQGPDSVAAADVNKDGWVDLICANDLDNTLSVFTNNRQGDFGLSGTYAVGTHPNWVISADVNKDGWPDLISANYLGNSLSVLTNDRSGSFVLCSSPQVGVWPLCVVAADVNGDGYVDLISADSSPNPGGNTLSVCTNDGSGRFVRAAAYPVGNNPCGVVAADVNGDGYVDLVSANFQDNTLTVLTNDGVGGFSPCVTAPVGVSPRGLTTADFNGDGQPDFASANFNIINALDGTVSVLINAPILNINAHGNSAMVSYPSSWTNWTLLKTTNLATGTWLVEADIADDGTNRSHIIRSSTNNLFFRLSFP
jgi:hypothetical protein